MSIKSPLARVLGLGSAKEGAEHWWMQRVSAISNMLLGLWFVYAIATLPGYDYLDMMRFISDPMNGVLLSLLAASFCYHSFLGIQVVIEDYVHTPALKISSLLLSRFVHLFIAFASVYSILRIGLDT